LRTAPAPLDANPPMMPGPFATAKDLIAYLGQQGNDLERPALEVFPVIADIKAALSATPGCLLARLTGSGPTCYGIFEAVEAAEAAAAAIASAQPAWWVQATRLGDPSLDTRVNGCG
jgi:4-diphosphocytidyl-2-C-methyl-D-erythritol kinase